MFSVIVLSGGFSSRMLKPKFLLDFNQKTFIECIVEQYIKMKCKELIIVINNKYTDLLKSLNLPGDKVQIVVNKYPEKERFYSIQCGIKELKEKEYVFLHNVDNPFVNPSTIDALIRSIKNYDFAVPTFSNRGGHPVLLNKKPVEDIVSAQNTNQNFKIFLKKYRRINVPVKDKNILVNINTQDDYRSLKMNKLK